MKCIVKYRLVMSTRESGADNERSLLGILTLSVSVWYKHDSVERSLADKGNFYCDVVL